jgi:archaellum component FlaF (FlaF/FlaG flagellin family)
VKPIDQLLERVDEKISFGIYKFDIDEELKKIFGEPQAAIDEFNSSFKGRYSQELADALVRAGEQKLETEKSLTSMAILNNSQDFSSLVESMIFGDGELVKKSKEQKYILSERLFCIAMALEQIKEFNRELSEFTKGMSNEPEKVENLWWWK